MTDIIIDDINPQGSEFTTPPWMHITNATDITGGLTWAEQLAVTEAFSQGGGGRAQIDTLSMSTDLYRRVSHTQGVLDLRDYSMLNFTACEFSFSFFTRDGAGAHNFWTDDSHNGLALVTQLDDGAGRNLNAALTDYEDIIQGAYDSGVVELGDRKPWTTIPTFGPDTWDFNSDGLAYLNATGSRSNHPGYMFFSLVFGGIVDGATPNNWVTEKTQRVNIGVLTATLTYSGGSQPIQINVGDVWKDVGRIQQNVSGSAWSEVADLDINVGDVWKDKA